MPVATTAEHNGASQNADDAPLDWTGEGMFNLYLYEALCKRKLYKSAEAFRLEAGINPAVAPPIRSKEGLLFEYFAVLMTYMEATPKVTTGSQPEAPPSQKGKVKAERTSPIFKGAGRGTTLPSSVAAVSNRDVTSGLPDILSEHALWRFEPSNVAEDALSPRAWTVRAPSQEIEAQQNEAMFQQLFGDLIDINRASPMTGVETMSGGLPPLHQPSLNLYEMTSSASQPRLFPQESSFLPSDQEMLNMFGLLPEMEQDAMMPVPS
ncbi:hypothetical protein WOLCODRAFT_163612 [Wolfiporia cocos MD-104 SS10]|uniref:Uncharacterized protein n=1 Tax=Wolfiporia cocos (strain MD-104) TaxID=742152 RepID=A0A2H3JWJ1_WOLCO|nr:hypothetical protein WOLCODRAFT_163612 [Wolfiporia cocos MD-104 SS10]